MRNNTIKSFAVGVATCAAFIAGLVCAAKASASPVGDIDMSDEAISYAEQYEQYICGSIMGNPTVSGVMHTLVMVSNDGWGGYDSGAIVGYAVQDACPSQWPVLEMFVASVPNGKGVA